MRALAAVIGVAMMAALVSGCGVNAGDKEEGALAAARAYVDAIADRDPAAADAMTDPEVLTEDVERTGDTDIRAALVDAVDPITDTWLTLSTGTLDDTVTEYSVEVTYRIGEAIGGEKITVELKEGGDPSEVDDWQVTTPLLDGADTYPPGKSRIGDVELPTSDGMASIQGYPGGYRAEPVDPDEGDRARSVLLGAGAPPLTWKQRYAGRAG